MSSNRNHPREFDLTASQAASPPIDVAVAIGGDERRMHVRAYNHWVALLAGRDFPSIHDLESEDIEDFAAYSVLLDFTRDGDNPAIPHVGAAIREECGLDDNVRTIADVPSRSLLSRLTAHYMQIIANRAPIGFEAEFENPRGASISYRGILVPFSSDGDAIDFIYGVINWRPGAAITEGPEATSEAEMARAPQDATVEAAKFPHFAWEDGPLHDDEDGIVLPDLVLDDNPGLADRLSAARETAESVKAGEGRTRAALYTALSLAFDFAVAAQENPQEYAELLADSGVTAQARAPMTPIVKLVFGIDYDKARLTEFAAALSFAHRQQVAPGAFRDFIDKQPGGLKSLVAAERQARRPDRNGDSKSEAAHAKLRTARAISLADIPRDQEFAVIVTRRSADGTHAPVAIIEEEALIERVIRRAVRDAG